PLDEDQPERAPPHQAPMTEGARRQLRDVEDSGVHRTAPAGRGSLGFGSIRERNGQTRVPVSPGCFGQNQPVIATNSGSAKYTTAQGVKIESMKNADVAMAVRSGQTDGSGNSMR